MVLQRKDKGVIARGLNGGPYEGIKRVSQGLQTHTGDADLVAVACNSGVLRALVLQHRQEPHEHHT
jgi:hypothetical protein